MSRLQRLQALRFAAIWHVYGSEPGTEARRIRQARLRRISDAQRDEEYRVDTARLRRLAAYHKRAGKVAA